MLPAQAVKTESSPIPPAFATANSVEIFTAGADAIHVAHGETAPPRGQLVMRNGFLGVFPALLVGAGLTLAEAKPPALPAVAADAAALAEPPPAPAEKPPVPLPPAPTLTADQAAPCCDVKPPCGPPGRFWVG